MRDKYGYIYSPIATKMRVTVFLPVIVTETGSVLRVFDVVRRVGEFLKSSIRKGQWCPRVDVKPIVEMCVCVAYQY